MMSESALTYDVEEAVTAQHSPLDFTPACVSSMPQLPIYTQP